MQVESRFFNYNGSVSIHYKAGGSGPATLIFLHGFAASHTTWEDILPLIPTDRFHVILLDLKGFGLSAKPRDGAYSIEEQASIVCSFIREQGFPTVTLIGHSLGGGVALRVCMRMHMENDPVTVKRLVLIDSAAYPQRLPKFFRRLKIPLLGPLFFRLIPARIMVRRAMEMAFHDKSAITPERLERYRCYFRGRGLAYTLRATISCINPEEYAGIGEEYRKISVPCLIIWGDHDYIVRPKFAQMLHEDLPVSRLMIISRCGHNPHEERPAETFTAMEEFLRAD
jgi:pimeloyl-ACP methyl ester carboxylesterase